MYLQLQTLTVSYNVTLILKKRRTNDVLKIIQNFKKRVCFNDTNLERHLSLVPFPHNQETRIKILQN